MSGDAILLSSALRNNLLALQRNATLIDRTTARLASGLEVNSALDNPQNFFAAESLRNRAYDLSRRLDGVGQGLQTIRQGLDGLAAIENLLDVAEGIAVEELRKLQNAPPAPPAAVDPLNEQILAAGPVAYWRLNETSGGAAQNLGSIGPAANGTYINTPSLGVGPLYAGGDVAAGFNGTNESVNIPDNNLLNRSSQAQRTIELVFNADNITDRQVLYEEGGPVNAQSLYVFDGRVYVTARDAGAWGPAIISAPINAGETYHVAFTFDSSSGEFIGYLNGDEMGRTPTPVGVAFPSHSNDIAIGRMRQDTWFHDGVGNGNGFNFDGRISDVAVYNDALAPEVIESHALAVTGTVAGPGENEEFNMVLDQITQLAIDSRYRGVNLLIGDNLTTFFNEDGTSSLEIEGRNATSDGLDLIRQGFDNVETLEEIIARVRAAILEVRRYSTTLAGDLNIMTVREDFIEGSINNFLAGADKLVQADMNREGANLLAAQTREQMATISLSLALRSEFSIFTLFA